jgi:hypothetical protein
VGLHPPAAAGKEAKRSLNRNASAASSVDLDFEDLDLDFLRDDDETQAGETPGDKKECQEPGSAAGAGASLDVDVCKELRSIGDMFVYRTLGHEALQMVVARIKEGGPLVLVRLLAVRLHREGVSTSLVARATAGAAGVFWVSGGVSRWPSATEITISCTSLCWQGQALGSEAPGAGPGTFLEGVGSLERLVGVPSLSRQGLGAFPVHFWSFPREGHLGCRLPAVLERQAGAGVVALGGSRVAFPTLPEAPSKLCRGLYCSCRQCYKIVLVAATWPGGRPQSPKNIAPLSNKIHGDRR